MSYNPYQGTSRDNNITLSDPTSTAASTSASTVNVPIATAPHMHVDTSTWQFAAFTNDVPSSTLSDASVPRSIAAKTPSPTEVELATLRRSSSSSFGKRKRDVYDDILEGFSAVNEVGVTSNPQSSQSLPHSPNATWASLLATEASAAQPQESAFALEPTAPYHALAQKADGPDGTGLSHQHNIHPFHLQNHHHQHHQHQSFNVQSFLSRPWDAQDSFTSPNPSIRSDYSSYSASATSPNEPLRHQRAYSVSSELDLGRAYLGGTESDWSRGSSTSLSDAAHNSPILVPSTFDTSNSSAIFMTQQHSASSGLPTPSDSSTSSPHLTTFFNSMAAPTERLPIRPDSGDQGRQQRSNLAGASAASSSAARPSSAPGNVFAAEQSTSTSAAAKPSTRERHSAAVLANTIIPEYDTRAPSLCPDPPQSDFQTDNVSSRPRLQLDRLRNPGDRYTPRWVRNDGKEREGWCDKCPSGGWFRLKVSAYWFHQQFTHGTSSVTGLRFDAPLQMRKTLVRKRAVLEGLCPACHEWHRTSTSSSKPNWAAYYKHAHSCHAAAATSARARTSSRDDDSGAVSGQDARSDEDEEQEVLAHDSSRHSTPIAPFLHESSHQQPQQQQHPLLQRPPKRLNSASDVSGEEATT